jgi:hypothetical protein
LCLGKFHAHSTAAFKIKHLQNHCSGSDAEV